MKQFTFGVLAYNVEPYIIECLESIKYQIQSFGEDYLCYLIIAEDCSTDRTLALIEYWIEKNKHLFASVEVIKNIENKGLVQNIIGLYKKINTVNFKVIDGDDIFYKNNIFPLLENTDIVVTQTVHFKNGHTLSRDRNYFFDKLILDKFPLDILREEYTYTHIVDTPGVFFKRKFLKEGLYESMSNYKMLDDIPRWNYIFNQEMESIHISDNPYILYRIGSGVSTNSSHEKRLVFDSDVRALNKSRKKDSHFKRRYRRFKHSLFKIIDKCYYKKYSSVLKTLEYNISKVINEEGDCYLQFIIDKSEMIKKEFETNYRIINNK